MQNEKGVAGWIFLMILLVIGIILLGGATRLTNSGLSITEWKPITGALPPLSNADWVEEFAKYQQITEFKIEHPDMDLQGFKFIYWMEWSHRQLGRVIGLVYLLGFVTFAFMRRLKSGKFFRFLSILLLIGVQGAIGWWMVHSGLQEGEVSVAPTRLAKHLGLAFIILGLLVWLWFDIRQNWPVKTRRFKFRKRSGLLFGLVFLQIIAGAIMAGTHSGLSYNTWPLMDGRFFPDGYFIVKPLWVNLIENTTAIQFNHRFLAYIIIFVSIWLWIGSLKSKNASLKTFSFWLLLAIFFQIILGIITLLKIVPFEWAWAHQAGGIIVFILALIIARSTRVHNY